MKRTGPLSWLLAHLCQAARTLRPDPKPSPLPQRTRTTFGWRAELPPGHPEFWCLLTAQQRQAWTGVEEHLWRSLSTQQRQMWAQIEEHLGNLPAVPQQRGESE